MTNKNHSKTDYLAVIDIGSNSVRLVVFSGLTRVPDVIFNEKTMCGLGASVGVTGRMDDRAVDSALMTLKRFCLLCKEMGVKQIHTLATAAVRDAENGTDFVKLVDAECGLKVRVIDGEEEGRLAGLGVLAGQPNATGVMGDLGGGSLELAKVGGDGVTDTISLPIGPMRLQAMFNGKLSAIKTHLRDTFSEISWLSEKKVPNLYLVGGAWRNICKLMLWEQANNLTVLHGYRIGDTEIKAYCRRLMGLDPSDIPFAGQLASRRREVLPIAALILSELVKASRAKSVTISSYGIREGYVFDQLDDDVKTQDPFLYSCHVLAEERCRFPEHAELIYQWSKPLFDRTSLPSGDVARLHMAICLLSDIAWRGHPDFRAEKAVETVLHGNFVSVTHRDRAFLAVALNQSYGAPVEALETTRVLSLLSISEILEARIMGGALRLAQRISGGTKFGLETTSLSIEGRHLKLTASKMSEDIINDVVEKRFRQLGQLVGKKTLIEYH